MSGLAEVEDWVGQEWTFECGEDVNDVFEQIDEDWNHDRRERFSLVDVLRDDLPDFMVWLQERIDDECEDTTETITFPPERIETDESREEEIKDIKAEILEAKKELAELRDEEPEPRDISIIQRVTGFIRNLFRG